MTTLEVMEGLLVITISLIYLYFWRKREKKIKREKFVSVAIWTKIKDEWYHIVLIGGNLYINGQLSNWNSYGRWDRALTEDEISLLYNSGQGLSYTDFNDNLKNDLSIKVEA